MPFFTITFVLLHKEPLLIVAAADAGVPLHHGCVGRDGLVIQSLDAVLVLDPEVAVSHIFQGPALIVGAGPGARFEGGPVGDGRSRHLDILGRTTRRLESPRAVAVVYRNPFLSGGACPGLLGDRHAVGTGGSADVKGFAA